LTFCESCFHEICHFLAQAAHEKFPDADRRVAVGGFIFLRFFCPAVIAPDAHNLVKTIQSKDIRRGLVLVTKIIQNLANNVVFGGKEAFMVELNPFIVTNHDRVFEFLEGLTVRFGCIRDVFASQLRMGCDQVLPAEDPGCLPADDLRRLNEEDLFLLHRFLTENIERISKDMSVRKQQKPFAVVGPNSGPGQEARKSI
jgi:hypothetical protein